MVRESVMIFIYVGEKTQHERQLQKQIDGKKNSEETEIMQEAKKKTENKTIFPCPQRDNFIIEIRTRCHKKEQLQNKKNSFSFI